MIPAEFEENLTKLRSITSWNEVRTLYSFLDRCWKTPWDSTRDCSLRKRRYGKCSVIELLSAVQRSAMMTGRIYGPAAPFSRVASISAKPISAGKATGLLHAMSPLAEAHYFGCGSALVVPNHSKPARTPRSACRHAEGKSTRLVCCASVSYLQCSVLPYHVSDHR